MVMAGIEGFVGLEEQRKSVLADLRRTYSRDTTVSGEAWSGSDNSCTSFATTHSPHMVGVRIIFLIYEIEFVLISAVLGNSVLHMG